MRFMLYALLFAVPSITIADENVTTVAVRKAIPDRLVVLTFDDSAKSHYTVVRPLLKEYQFGATFFITLLSQKSSHRDSISAISFSSRRISKKLISHSSAEKTQMLAHP